MDHWQRTFKACIVIVKRKEGRDNGVRRKEGKKSVHVYVYVWVETFVVEFWENSDGGLAVSGVNL